MGTKKIFREIHGISTCTDCCMKDWDTRFSNVFGHNPFSTDTSEFDTKYEVKSAQGVIHDINTISRDILGGKVGTNPFAIDCRNMVCDGLPIARVAMY